ncbi:MAG: PHP domain-containing protein, partial [Desulfarculaceae bacterium]|nr:PHP domain-containing protein [Desulfarculaceae bacterium]
MVLPVVRSHYSLMQGTASPKALAHRAKKLGYPCLALADVDNLYGLWEFRRACRENGLRAITGSEVTQPGGVGRAWCLV